MSILDEYQNFGAGKAPQTYRKKGTKWYPSEEEESDILSEYKRFAMPEPEKIDRRERLRQILEENKKIIREQRGKQAYYEAMPKDPFTLFRGAGRVAKPAVDLLASAVTRRAQAPMIPEPQRREAVKRAEEFTERITKRRGEDPASKFLYGTGYLGATALPYGKAAQIGKGLGRLAQGSKALPTLGRFAPSAGRTLGFVGAGQLLAEKDEDRAQRALVDTAIGAGFEIAGAVGKEVIKNIAVRNVRVNLTKTDIRTILRGKKVDPLKYEAYKKIVQEGRIKDIRGGELRTILKEARPGRLAEMLSRKFGIKPPTAQERGLKRLAIPERAGAKPPTIIPKPTPKPPVEVPAGISKELEPLATEARKYKSAEEFVKAQELLYHGTSKESAAAIKKAGGFTPETAKSGVDLVGGKVSDSPVAMTLDEATGKLYAGPRPEGGTGELLTFSGKGLKIADEATANKFGRDITKLKNAGYDGYHTSSPHDEMIETIVFNKEKLKLTTQTKSQLTDFYNKATEIKPVEAVKIGRRIPDELFATEEGGKLYDEIANAQAGERIVMRAGDGDVVGTTGVKSTFPDWVPDDLKDRNLFDRAQKYLLKGVAPKEGKVAELYDAIHDELLKRTGGLPERTSEIIDPDEIFAKGRIPNLFKTKKETIVSKPSPLKEFQTSRFDKFMTSIQDRYRPIQKITEFAEETSGKKLRPSESPYNKALSYLGNVGKAESRIEFELKPILKNVSDDLDNFREFLKVERAKELSERGITTGVDITKKFTPEQIAKFENISNAIYEYQRAGLKKLADSGVLSQDMYEKLISENKKYVPFNRVMDELEKTDLVPSTKSAFSVKYQNVVKKIKGSEREIIDPIESIVKKTYQIEELADRNNITKSIVGLKDLSPDVANIIKEVKAPLVPVANIEHKAAIDKQFNESIKEFLELFGGKITTKGQPGKTLGYQYGKDVVRKFATPREVTSHETGHFVDRMYELYKNTYKRKETRQVSTEVLALMEKMGESKSRMAKPKERFADAFEWWLTHRDQAKKDIPAFSKLMQKTISSNEELRPLLKIKPSPRVDLESMKETIFRPSPFGPKGNVVSVFENGEKKYYEVPKELYETMSGLREEQLGFMMKALSLPTRTLRAGATSLNPDFMFPNIIRDQLSAFVNAKYGYVPIYDFIKGLTSYAGKGESYKKFLESGASQSFLVSLDRPNLQKELTGMVASGKMKAIKTTNPLTILQNLSELSEKPTRIGVFERAYKKALKEFGDPEDATAVAMREAREATVDFARRGQATKGANALIAFLNARFQGAVKLARSIKERPLATSLRVVGGVMVPAATAYVYNSQFSEYQDIPDYVKKDNFILMLGNDKYIKVPKGDIGKIFANPVENILASIYKHDPKSIAQLTGELLGEISPVGKPREGGWIPTAFKIPAEIMTNKDIYRGKDIVPYTKQDLEPREQYTKKTSGTAKKIGDIFNISPAKLEQGVYGLTGGVGRTAMNITDWVTGAKNPEQKDIPVARRFFGTDFSKPESKLYDTIKKAERESKRESYEKRQNIENLLRQGKDEEVKRILDEELGYTEKGTKKHYKPETLEKKLKVLKANPYARMFNNMSKEEQMRIWGKISDDLKRDLEEFKKF